MKISTFDVFWDKAILPYCQKIFSELSNDVVQNYKVKLNIDAYFKNRIHSVYNDYRNYVHKYCFGGRKDALIDRHKISVCISAALIKCRPISYLMYNPIPAPLILSNYKIGFFAGLKALYLLRLAQWVKDGNMSDLADALFEQKMFRFPKTNEGHDEYSLGCIKSIALTDLQNYPFDILAYSNIFYWIERFNEENLFRIINQSND